MSAKEIAERVGVGINTVYRWTKELRDKAKQERDQAVLGLADEGKKQQQIADELDLPQKTVSNILLSQNTQMVEMAKDTAKEPSPEASEPEKDTTPVREQVDKPEPESESPSAEPETDDSPTAEEGPDTQDQEQSEPPPPPEPIPDDILKTARAVMGEFAETRPDDYVAKFEASGSEWMTITDDSLSNELERELLTSAAAMCLWQEWMIWYQGEETSAFTDAFGKIGPVFVRGQAGQWNIVSKLRSILRRLSSMS